MSVNIAKFLKAYSSKLMILLIFLANYCTFADKLELLYHLVFLIGRILQLQLIHINDKNLSITSFRWGK